MKLNLSRKGIARSAAGSPPHTTLRLTVAQAQSRLSRAVGEVLSGSLDALEGRLASRLGHPKASEAQAERMRDVLDRDRALAAAQPGPRPDSSKLRPPVSVPPERAVPPERTAPLCDEPVRTRTMARLLASQGYTERALSIYAVLLIADPDDASLRAEADALREQKQPA